MNLLALFKVLCFIDKTPKKSLVQVCCSYNIGKNTKKKQIKKKYLRNLCRRLTSRFLTETVVNLIIKKVQFCSVFVVFTRSCRIQTTYLLSKGLQQFLQRKRSADVQENGSQHPPLHAAAESSAGVPPSRTKPQNN